MWRLFYFTHLFLHFLVGFVMEFHMYLIKQGVLESVLNTNGLFQLHTFFSITSEVESQCVDTQVVSKLFSHFIICVLSLLSNHKPISKNFHFVYHVV